MIEFIMKNFFLLMIGKYETKKYRIREIKGDLGKISLNLLLIQEKSSILYV